MNDLLRRAVDILDRIQPHLRHIPDVTHTEIEELRSALRVEIVSGDKHRKALREIAFWLPTVCYEHNGRRYCDIEDVYALKRIAADARDEKGSK